MFIFNLKAPLVAKPRKRKRANLFDNAGESDNFDGSQQESLQTYSTRSVARSLQRSQPMKSLSIKKIVVATSAVSATVPIPRHASKSSKERQGILVHRPAEAALSSNSYTVSYSESMSYGSTDHSPRSSPKDSEPIIHNAKSAVKNR